MPWPLPSHCSKGTATRQTGRSASHPSATCTGQLSDGAAQTHLLVAVADDDAVPDTVLAAVTLGVAVAVSVAVWLPVDVAVSDDDGELLGVDEGVWVDVDDTLAVALAVTVDEIVPVAVWDGVSDGVALPVDVTVESTVLAAVAVTVPLPVDVIEGVALAVPLIVPLPVADSEGVGVELAVVPEDGVPVSLQQQHHSNTEQSRFHMQQRGQPANEAPGASRGVAQLPLTSPSASRSLRVRACPSRCR